MQSEEQKKILERLIEYAEKSHKSYSFIARKLGITQNTISNWRKGYAISARNQEKILALVATAKSNEICTVQKCSCRNTNDMLLCSLLSVLKDLPERDLAKIYAFALELRDAPVQYRYTSTGNSILRAAEDQVPFNKI